MESFPDPSSLTDDELRALITELAAQKSESDYMRRVALGKDREESAPNCAAAARMPVDPIHLEFASLDGLVPIRVPVRSRYPCPKAHPSLANRLPRCSSDLERRPEYPVVSSGPTTARSRRPGTPLGAKTTCVPHPNADCAWPVSPFGSARLPVGLAVRAWRGSLGVA